MPAQSEICLCMKARLDRVKFGTRLDIAVDPQWWMQRDP